MKSYLCCQLQSSGCCCPSYWMPAVEEKSTFSPLHRKLQEITAVICSISIFLTIQSILTVRQLLGLAQAMWTYQRSTLSNTSGCYTVMVCSERLPVRLRREAGDSRRPLRAVPLRSCKPCHMPHFCCAKSPLKTMEHAFSDLLSVLLKFGLFQACL